MSLVQNSDDLPNQWKLDHKCKSKDDWKFAFLHYTDSYGTKKDIVVADFQDIQLFEEEFKTIQTVSRNRRRTLWDYIESKYHENRYSSWGERKAIFLEHLINGYHVDVIDDKEIIYESISMLRMDGKVTAYYYLGCSWNTFSKRMKFK